ncbi:facilitated trehalose transporter Tret1-like [Glossina fuscipes]|uniref:Facilitated trehalose transporter Tret1-like n=1 Tax=Glossina fuscipes TaxID=7396 RepID=A0A9C5YZV2_9MUSC|nr:facilitated trehalose transporter Tret1-like [Glossina fuscipes]
MVVVAKDLMSRKSLSILNINYRYQLFAALTVQLITFTHGISTGWLSPTLFHLQNDHTSPDFTLTVTEISWIGSLFGLGSLLGNIMFGVLLDRIGRKWCMYMLALPVICAWFLIYFAKTHVYLYVARFLIGITGGGNYVVVPIFISEIADPSIRGALSSMAMLMLSFGILAGYIMSTYLDYYVNPFIIVIFPLLYLIAVTQFPETPQHLLRKHKISDARESFKFYRNMPKTIEANSLPELRTAFEELKDNILKANGKSEKLQVDDFFNKEALRAFFTAIMLVSLNQLSGSFAIVNYLSDIFAHTGTDIDPNTCTIIMGVVQIFGTCFSMIVVDRVGRKVLLLASAGGTALSYTSFGIYVKFASSEIKLQYNWLPLVIMTFVIFSTSIGLLAQVFTVIVETLPIKVRSAGTSFSMAALSCMVFVALKLFPELMEKYGLDNLMFGCTAICVVGFLYVLIFLKETKGKLLDK